MAKLKPAPTSPVAGVPHWIVTGFSGGISREEEALQKKGKKRHREEGMALYVKEGVEFAELTV